MALIQIPNERVIMVDIDDTLVMHGHAEAAWVQDEHCVQIPDPVHPGKFVELVINENMIRLVKEEMHRGSQIVFWSRGGYAWATAVVETLELNEVAGTLPPLVMTKPYAYFDDSDVSSWLKDRVYIGPDKKYKK